MSSLSLDYPLAIRLLARIYRAVVVFAEALVRPDDELREDNPLLLASRVDVRARVELLLRPDVLPRRRGALTLLRVAAPVL